jgi:hypothetical protein
LARLEGSHIPGYVGWSICREMKNQGFLGRLKCLLAKPNLITEPLIAPLLSSRAIDQSDPILDAFVVDGEDHERLK